MIFQILNCDVLAGLHSLEAESVQTCVTSPPYYGLRDYGVDGQIGLEPTPEAYVSRLVEVFRDVRRVLRADGTLWLNLGDSYNSSGEVGRHEARCSQRDIGATKKFFGTDRQYAKRETGLKPKDLIGIPWRVAFALQADGWYLRSDIIWHKRNPLPESVRDRPTKAHEYLFLLAKSERYMYDSVAIKEDGKLKVSGNTQHKYADGKSLNRTKANLLKIRAKVYERVNKRTVWSLTSQPFKGAHFAVMPEKLVEPCVLAGSRPGDLVLDPFAGSGTVGLVANRFGRSFVGCELNATYATMANERLALAA